MIRIKNFMPAIRIEGFDKATDSSRSEGAFGKEAKTTQMSRVSQRNAGRRKAQGASSPFLR